MVWNMAFKIVPGRKKTADKMKGKEDELRYKEEEFEKLKEEIKNKKFV